MVNQRYHSSPRNEPPEIRTKVEQSAKIAADVDAYLAAGNEIVSVGSEANAYAPGGRNDATRGYPPRVRRKRDYQKKTTT